MVIEKYEQCQAGNYDSGLTTLELGVVEQIKLLYTLHEIYNTKKIT